MTIRDFIASSAPLALGLSLSLLFSSARARADEPALTRQRIAALVKEAPGSRVARSETDVARAGAAAAGAWSLENPVLSGLGGARFNPDGSRSLAAVGSLSWPIELGGKRGARVDAAKSELVAASARSEQEQRQVLLAALLQHACVLRDERQLTLATERHALSARLVNAAQRRKAAGSVPELDVALAGLQEKRDSSLAASAAGERDGDRLRLEAMLGIPETTGVAGELIPAEQVQPLPLLLARSDRQLEVQSAATAVDAAQARARRERAARTPTLSLLAQYERDDEANIGLLGVSLPIPVLDANRTEVASSNAQITVARAQLALARAQAVGQVKALYARYLASKAALEALQPTAELSNQAVTLATRGYELGENDLASVLLVRREAVEAQAALLEAQYAHAAIKLELLVTSGRLPQ